MDAKLVAIEKRIVVLEASDKKLRAELAAANRRIAELEKTKLPENPHFKPDEWGTD